MVVHYFHCNEVYLFNSDLGPTVAELKALQPKLYLRSFDDFATAPAWWQQYSPHTSPSEVDSWHEGYAADTGICLKTRLHINFTSHHRATFRALTALNITPMPILSTRTWLYRLLLCNQSCLTQRMKLYHSCCLLAIILQTATVVCGTFCTLKLRTW